MKLYQNSYSALILSGRFSAWLDKQLCWRIHLKSCFCPPAFLLLFLSFLNALIFLKYFSFLNQADESSIFKSHRCLKEHFRCGFFRKEMIHFLETFHDKSLSIRRLHRISWSEVFYRKTLSSDSRYVIQIIENEISESGSSLSYCQLQQRWSWQLKSSIQKVMSKDKETNCNNEIGKILFSRTKLCMAFGWLW